MLCDKIVSEGLEEMSFKEISLVEFARKQTELYIADADIEGRKKKGQFFTPAEVSGFMSGLFSFSKVAKQIRLLDPGAGTGILTAAFCDSLLAKNYEKLTLTIDLYEKDQKVLPYLTKVMNACRLKFKNNNNWNLQFNIISKDFIFSHSGLVQEQLMFGMPHDFAKYDYVISNPPYFKLNKDDPESKLMGKFVSGQPNIYSFFMALSLLLLKDKGETVFITPRSFCSGLYYKKFRKWLIENYSIRHIHVFDSRRNVFHNESVLQENIIIKISCRKSNGSICPLVVTSSSDSMFHDIKKLKLHLKDIYHRKNGDIFIKIPSSELDLQVEKTLKRWDYTFHDFGLEVSTGPIVSFRAKKHLVNAPANGEKLAPLLWMHNIQGMGIEWPLDKGKKQRYILDNEGTKSLLLPAKNYVLLKRFTSKEQKRRLYAGVLLRNAFKSKRVGLENHLNYIHKKNGDISNDEAIGFAAFLNTSFVDRFFRVINGNTQVNAVDLRGMPLPPLRKVKEIGDRVSKERPSIGKDLDLIVSSILGFSKRLVNCLNIE